MVGNQSRPDVVAVFDHPPVARVPLYSPATSNPAPMLQARTGDTLAVLVAAHEDHLLALAYTAITNIVPRTNDPPLNDLDIWRHYHVVDDKTSNGNNNNDDDDGDGDVSTDAWYKEGFYMGDADASNPNYQQNQWLPMVNSRLLAVQVYEERCACLVVEQAWWDTDASTVTPTVVVMEYASTEMISFEVVDRWELGHWWYNGTTTSSPATLVPPPTTPQNALLSMTSQTIVVATGQTNENNIVYIYDKDNNKKPSGKDNADTHWNRSELVPSNFGPCIAVTAVVLTEDEQNLAVACRDDVILLFHQAPSRPETHNAPLSGDSGPQSIAWNFVQLISEADPEISPAWSRDGTWLVVQSSKSLGLKTYRKTKHDHRSGDPWQRIPELDLPLAKGISLSADGTLLATTLPTPTGDGMDHSLKDEYFDSFSAIDGIFPRQVQIYSRTNEV